MLATALTLRSIILAEFDAEQLEGAAILRRLLDVADSYVREMRGRIAAGTLSPRAALFGRVRGTGPGVSFTRLIQRLRDAIPIPLQSPFEETESVAGAVLRANELIDPARDDAALVLRFEVGSRELPMHAHLDSDRFLYVAEGRGFFHLNPEPVEDFTGIGIRHIPVRPSDIVMFSRGTMHTFSTELEPLTLLSCHAPFVPLADPRQYVLPRLRICPGATVDARDSNIVCDPAWLSVA